jgi:tRNA(Ile)-lysidine synthase
MEWRTDASNLSPEFLRNRIRHRLLPLLRQEFNPRIDQAVLRLAEIAGEEDRWIGRHTESLLDQLLLSGAGPGSTPQSSISGAKPVSSECTENVCLILSSFVQLPLALRRRLLLAAVRRAGGSLRHLGYQNVSDCLEFLTRGSPGGTVQLPGGVRVSKDSTCFTVAAGAGVRSPDASFHEGRQERTAVAPRALGARRKRRERDGQKERPHLFNAVPPCPLTVPGKTPLPGLGLAIIARVLDIAPGTWRPERDGCLSLRGRNRMSGDETHTILSTLDTEGGTGESWIAGDNNRTFFDYEQLDAPLTVRTRREGDRLRPFGMRGVKKLKKLLGELHIPGGQRDQIPLVISGGEIIWVAGWRRAQVAPVTEQTRHILILETERL